MAETVIKIENLSKQYRLGVIGHGTLYKDLQSWCARLRGREDPNARITDDMTPGLQGERFWALKNISLAVEKGEVLGIIGRNGAGKSTLLKILSRVTTPTEGRAKIKGRIASLLEVGTGFHPELTGRDNTYLNGVILGMSKREISRKFDEIVEFSGLSKFIDTPVKRYSSGMYVRLAFAVAAHLEPEILIVDEVLAVGDVEFQKKCLGKMGEVAKGGRTILFVSHNMAAIRNLCPRVILLDKGELIVDSEAEQTIERYLGQNLLAGAVASKEEIESRMEGRILRRPTIRLLKICVADESGNLRQSFNSDEQVRVSVDFECYEHVQDLRILVQLVDKDSVPLLITQNVDDPQIVANYHKLEPGRYSSSCSFPANTFGGRRFFLSVDLIHPKTEHLKVKKILEFEVDFMGYSNIQYGSGKHAFLRPQLMWTMRPVSRKEFAHDG